MSEMMFPFFNNMKDKRPKLTDTKEYALIKSIYFEKDYINKEKIDPIERLDRMESKQRNQNKNSR